MTEKIGPSYQQVADDIRSRITSGELAVGAMIPSTTDLRRHYGQSETVVRRAVRELQNCGVLIGHPGKGVFVKATPEEATRGRVDIKTLGEEVIALREQVRELAKRESDSDLTELLATVGRIEANLITLYGKTGHAYPRGGSRDGTKATARRGRAR